MEVFLIALVVIPLWLVFKCLVNLFLAKDAEKIFKEGIKKAEAEKAAKEHRRAPSRGNGGAK